jgi:glycosyltransferase involved in cell wall biosynthesis
MNIVILITTYNSSKTIGATLDSIKVQGEILNKISAVYIADDCSTDDTILLAKAHWDIAVPLRIIKRSCNLGEWRNVNQAIETLAQNFDWILYMHSDNLAKPEWLKIMISRIEVCSERVATICSSWDTLLPDGTVILGEDNPGRPVEVINGNNESVRGTLLRGCWWHNSGCALRAHALKSTGDFNPQLKQKSDWEWLLHCLHKGWSVEYVPRTLFFYRQHQSSQSSKNLRQDIDIKDSLKIVRQYMWVLSKDDLLSFHLQHTKFIFRRIGRALIQLHVVRCFGSGVTLALIFLSLIQCLYKKVDEKSLC